LGLIQIAELYHVAQRAVEDVLVLWWLGRWLPQPSLRLFLSTHSSLQLCGLWSLGLFSTPRVPSDTSTHRRPPSPSRPRHRQHRHVM